MTRPIDFRFVRWSASFNTAVQVILFLSLFFGVTSLAIQHFQRIDLTRQYRYSLSPETVAHLEQLARPVEIFVTISADSDDVNIQSLYTDVRNLLREYEYASRHSPGGGIRVEFVNVFQQRGKARMLAERYGIDQSELILLASGNRQRLIFPNEIYVTEGRKRVKFRGEEVLTAAILDVAGDEQKKLYFISGHGQMEIDDVDPIRGLSQFADALRQRNFQLQQLDLSRVTSIPEDADMALIIAPQVALMRREEEMLRDYLSRNAGRVLVMVEPGVNHGMDNLFFEWGVLVDDTRVVDTGPDSLAAGGDLLLRRFINHPLTRTLLDNQIPLISGLSRSVRVDPGRPIGDSLQALALIGTSETSWGQRHHNQRSEARFNPDIDIPGPLSVAVVSERRIASNLPIEIPGGRLIVFGAADFAANSRINALGNLTLMLNAINWATDRDRMVSVPPRPIETIQLVLSRQDTNRLRFTTLILFPGMAALCGVIIYWIRRK